MYAVYHRTRRAWYAGRWLWVGPRRWATNAQHAKLFPLVDQACQIALTEHAGIFSLVTCRFYTADLSRMLPIPYPLSAPEAP